MKSQTFAVVDVIPDTNFVIGVKIRFIWTRFDHAQPVASTVYEFRTNGRVRDWADFIV